MKNLLLATSALVATAGFAAADVNVGGYGFVGVTNVAGTSSVEHKMRVTFAASVETDSGVTFGASSRMNISNNAGNVAANALEHGKITVSTGGLTMAVGATNGAMKTQARVATFHGFNDGGGLYAGGNSGVDNNVGLGDGGNNVLVTYAMNGFTLAAASDVAGTTTEFGASYAANGLSVGAGIDNGNQWMAKVGYSANGMSINVGTNDNSDIVVTGSYAASDALSLGLGYDKDATGNNVGLNVAYSLGGGATMTANVARLHGTSAAGLGVQFSF